MVPAFSGSNVDRRTLGATTAIEDRTSAVRITALRGIVVG